MHPASPPQNILPQHQSRRATLLCTEDLALLLCTRYVCSIQRSTTCIVLPRRIFRRILHLVSCLRRRAFSTWTGTDALFRPSARLLPLGPDADILLHRSPGALKLACSGLPATHPTHQVPLSICIYSVLMYVVTGGGLPIGNRPICGHFAVPRACVCVEGCAAGEQRPSPG
jgi:hypothetical protein